MYVAHRRKIVDLIGLCLLDDAGKVHRVGHIAVMKDKISVFYVGILVEMVDPVGVKEGSSSFDTVDDIAFFE